MTVFYTLAECAATFIEVYVILCIFGFCFETRFGRGGLLALKLGFTVGVSLLTLWLNTLSLYSYMTAGIWMLLVAAVSLLLYRSNFLQAFCIAVVYLVLINAVDFLSLSVIELLFQYKGITLEVMTGPGLFRSVWLVCVKTLLVTTCVLLSRLKRPLRLPGSKICCIIIASGCFCFFCMQYLIEAVVIGNVADMRRAVLIAWLFIFLFIVCFLLILRASMRAADERMEKSIVADRLEALEESNRDLNEAYREIAKLSHDFKNHMRAMTVLAQNDRIDELKDYLREVSSDVDGIRVISYTGVDSVDAVINNKKHSAEKQDIRIEIDAAPLGNLQIRSMDLCAVIVNLLDNAIEACLRQSAADARRIRFSIAPVHSMLVVKAENPYAETSLVRKPNGGLSTAKADRRAHGYGLQIIQSITEKYSGSFEINCENQEFTAVAMLANSN